MSRTDNATNAVHSNFGNALPKEALFSTFRYLKPNLTELTELKILFSISNKA